MLCDGASPENIASTVVDCTKIDTGHIGFFRVGLIPKSKVINTLCHICSCLFSLQCHPATEAAGWCLCVLKVLKIFEEVQKRHQQGQINSAFEYDLDLPTTQTEGNSVNEAERANRL